MMTSPVPLAAAADEAVLHADCIIRSHGTRRILTAATLSARSGQVTGLLGRMGAGKSTLLKICAGVLAPDGGWVRFRGRQHLRPRHALLARDGLFYLADRANLLDTLTVRAQCRMIERRFGTSRLATATDILKLDAVLDRVAGTLSGGERRRAELALAVVRAPTCLLADEPFRGIDPISAELVGAALRHLAAERCAVVVTGHEISLLIPHLDDVVWVTAGTTRALGTPEIAWKVHAFRAEYLGAASAERGAWTGKRGVNGERQPRMDAD